MLITILRYSLQMSAKVSKKARKTHVPHNKSPNANKFRKTRSPNCPSLKNGLRKAPDFYGMLPKKKFGLKIARFLNRIISFSPGCRKTIPLERGTASQENTDYHAIIIHAEVLCFHGKQRCVTCKAIEKYTQEVVNADLVKNGKLRFKEVDISCRDIVLL